MNYFPIGKCWLFASLVTFAFSVSFTISLAAEDGLSTPCNDMNSIAEAIIGDLGIGWGYGSGRLWYAGEKVWFEIGEPSEDEPGKIVIIIQETQESPKEVVAEVDYPGTVSYTFESHRFLFSIDVLVDWPTLGPKATLLDMGCYSTGETQPFPFNAGANDAWYVPNLDGHGVLLTVHPSIERIFLALFTFDTQQPPEGVTAILGDPAQRWITAFGPYEVNTAHLGIEVTAGGVFLERNPMPVWLHGGTIDLNLNHCNDLKLDYDIPSIGRRGTLQLKRVVNDRIELCELLTVTDDE